MLSAVRHAWSTAGHPHAVASVYAVSKQNLPCACGALSQRLLLTSLRGTATCSILMQLAAGRFAQGAVVSTSSVARERLH
jgi:hypothetical protein